MHRTPTSHLGSHVAAGIHQGQRRGPARAVAASPQHRWFGVEHLSTTEYLTAAGGAQYQPVAQNQRQRTLHGFLALTFLAWRAGVARYTSLGS